MNCHWGTFFRNFIRWFLSETEKSYNLKKSNLKMVVKKGAKLKLKPKNVIVDFYPMA